MRTLDTGPRKLPMDTEDIMVHQDHKEAANKQVEEGNIEAQPEGLVERVV